MTFHMIGALLFVTGALVWLFPRVVWSQRDADEHTRQMLARYKRDDPEMWATLVRLDQYKRFKDS